MADLAVPVVDWKMTSELVMMSVLPSDVYGTEYERRLCSIGIPKPTITTLYTLEKGVLDSSQGIFLHETRISAWSERNLNPLLVRVNAMPHSSILTLSELVMLTQAANRLYDQSLNLPSVLNEPLILAAERSSTHARYMHSLMSRCLGLNFSLDQIAAYTKNELEHYLNLRKGNTSPPVWGPP